MPARMQELLALRVGLLSNVQTTFFCSEGKVQSSEFRQSWLQTWEFLSFAILLTFQWWHGGSWQIGTPWMDGTAAISQCAINPEETFTYRFVVDKVTDLQLLITDHPIVPECSCHEIN